MGARSHPRRRPHVRGQPGPAPRGRRPRREAPRQSLLRAAGGRPALARDVRPQDQGTRLPGLPVDRRADGRALPGARRSLHRHAAQVVHVHERNPRRLAGPGDLQPLVRLPVALRRAPSAPDLAGPEGAGPDDLRAGHGHPGRDAPGGPDPGPADVRGGPRGLRAACGRAHPVRRRRGRRDARRPGRGLRALVLALSAAGHARAVVVSRGRRRAARRQARQGRRRRLHAGTRALVRRRASPATAARAPAACGPPRRPTAGGRAGPDARSRT